MPLSMYLRTVLGSRPVRRAIAVIVSPCRCNSRIIISSPSRTIGAFSPQEGDGTDVGSTIQPGLVPAEWLASPSPADGTVAISAAQLAYMLDGIDWRNPRH